MQPVYILGVGMTRFGRHLQRSLREVTEEAVQAALSDAGVTCAEVQSISFANAVQGAMEGQFGIRGQVALNRLPFGNIPVINLESACASASTALQIAVTQLRGEAGARQVENARIAMQENGGGLMRNEEAAVVVSILEKAQ